MRTSEKGVIRVNQEARKLAYEVMQCALLRLIDSNAAEKLLVKIHAVDARYEASRNALAGIRELQEWERFR